MDFPHRFGPLARIDDLFLRILPLRAGDELADMLIRRDEKAPTLATSNRPSEDWARLLRDTVVVTPLLDRLLHCGHGASLLQSEEQACPYSLIWVDCIT